MTGSVYHSRAHVMSSGAPRLVCRRTNLRAVLLPLCMWSHSGPADAHTSMLMQFPPQPMQIVHVDASSSLDRLSTSTGHSRACHAPYLPPSSILYNVRVQSMSVVDGLMIRVRARARNADIPSPRHEAWTTSGVRRACTACSRVIGAAECVTFVCVWCGRCKC